MSKKRPDGYWEEWKNIEHEINEVIRKLGHFPTQGELKKLGFSSLGGAISKYPGGMYEIAKQMGYEPKQKPRGYWKDWENVERELTILQDQLGHFPTDGEIREHDSMLNVAILRYHGKIFAVRERMDIPQQRNEHGSWRDISKIISELEPIIDKLGHFPSYSEIKDVGRGDLQRAMQRYHSMNEVRKAMGYDPIRIAKVRDTSVDVTAPTPRDYWGDFENLRNEMEIVIEENGGNFPTEPIMRKRGRNDVVNACRRHGGFPAVRKRMGYDGRNSNNRQLPRESNQLADWNWFSSEMLRIIEDNNGEFPSSNQLKERERNDLIRAMRKYHGKTKEVRARLGFSEGHKSRRYWHDPLNITYELLSFMTKNNLTVFPSGEEIREYGGQQIFQAISAHFPGKTEGICGVLGIDRRERKPTKYWKDWDNFSAELNNAIEEIGRFPTLQDLNAQGHYALAHGMRYHGGFSGVKERMGYAESQNGSLLEQYVGGAQ